MFNRRGIFSRSLICSFGFFVFMCFIFPFSVFAALHEGSTTDCDRWLTGWDEACLMDKLKTDFNITSADVIDTELLQYVQTNRANIIALLTKIDHGKRVESFVQTTSNEFFESDTDFIDLLDNAYVGFWGNVVDVLSILQESTVLAVCSETLGTLDTVISGIKAYRIGVNNLTAYDTRQIFFEYRSFRDSQMSSATAWSELYLVYEPVMLSLAVANGLPIGTDPEKALANELLRQKFEIAYDAYRQVRYADDSDGLRTGQGRAIARLATHQLIVDNIDVTPRSMTVGNSVTVSYTVSNIGGPGLQQVELWRAPVADAIIGTWTQIGQPVLLTGEGPTTGSFSDTPPNVGSYAYGIHVLNNDDQMTTEREPITVSVNPPLGLTDLVINGPSTVNENSSTALTATATWDDGSQTTVTPIWSVVSPYAIVTPEGLLDTTEVSANQVVKVNATLYVA
jgi:hypothetical protein